MTSKKSIERQNPYLDYLIDPNFQGVNIFFVQSVENKNDRKIHTEYFLPKVEIKGYNVVIERKNFNQKK